MLSFHTVFFLSLSSPWVFSTQVPHYKSTESTVPLGFQSSLPPPSSRQSFSTSHKDTSNTLPIRPRIQSVFSAPELAQTRTLQVPDPASLEFPFDFLMGANQPLSVVGQATHPFGAVIGSENKAPSPQIPQPQQKNSKVSGTAFPREIVSDLPNSRKRSVSLISPETSQIPPKKRYPYVKPFFSIMKPESIAKIEELIETCKYAIMPKGILNNSRVLFNINSSEIKYLVSESVSTLLQYSHKSVIRLIIQILLFSTKYLQERDLKPLEGILNEWISYFDTSLASSSDLEMKLDVAFTSLFRFSQFLFGLSREILLGCLGLDPLTNNLKIYGLLLSVLGDHVFTRQKELNYLVHLNPDPKIGYEKKILMWLTEIIVSFILKSNPGERAALMAISNLISACKAAYTEYVLDIIKGLNKTADPESVPRAPEPVRIETHFSNKILEYRSGTFIYKIANITLVGLACIKLGLDFGGELRALSTLYCAKHRISLIRPDLPMDYVHGFASAIISCAHNPWYILRNTSSDATKIFNLVRQYISMSDTGMKFAKFKASCIFLLDHTNLLKDKVREVLKELKRIVAKGTEGFTWCPVAIIEPFHYLSLPSQPLLDFRNIYDGEKLAETLVMRRALPKSQRPVQTLPESQSTVISCDNTNPPPDIVPAVVDSKFSLSRHQSPMIPVSRRSRRSRRTISSMEDIQTPFLGNEDSMEPILQRGTLPVESIQNPPFDSESPPFDSESPPFGNEGSIFFGGSFFNNDPFFDESRVCFFESE